MRSNVKSLVALALAVAVLLCPTTVLAQEATGTAAEGAVAGQVDGGPILAAACGLVLVVCSPTSESTRRIS